MTDRDSWNDAQKEPTPPAKKKGMSGCMIAFLICGGFGFLSLLVCGGIGFWIFRNSTLKNTSEPAEVTAIARQIMNTEIIDGLSPAHAMSMDNMLFTFNIAEFTHKEGKGEMMMGFMKMKMGDPNQAKMQTPDTRGKFEEKLQKNLDIKNTEKHEITINGQKVSVDISEATDRNSGKEVHTATTDFDQANGKAFMVLQLSDDVWDQDAVLKMLEDIKP